LSDGEILFCTLALVRARARFATLATVPAFVYPGPLTTRVRDGSFGALSGGAALRRAVEIASLALAHRSGVAATSCGFAARAGGATDCWHMTVGSFLLALVAWYSMNLSTPRILM